MKDQSSLLRGVFFLVYLWILFKTGKIFCRFLFLFLFLFLFFSLSIPVSLSLEEGEIARTGFPMLAVDSNRVRSLATATGSSREHPTKSVANALLYPRVAGRPLNMEGKRCAACSSLSTRDQRPSKRTVTYRPCMPRISVHHYVSLESQSRAPSLDPPEGSRTFQHEYPSIQPIMFNRGPDIARGIGT